MNRRRFFFFSIVFGVALILQYGAAAGSKRTDLPEASEAPAWPADRRQAGWGRRWLRPLPSANNFRTGGLNAVTDPGGLDADTSSVVVAGRDRLVMLLRASDGAPL